MSQNVTEFQWSDNRLKAAKLLAEGTKTHEEIAKECGIARETISRWKQHPEFLEKIDEFTLSHELATKAGLLRELYKGADKKRENIDSDKTTHLDYMKAIADVQGHKKHKVEHSGTVEHTGGVVVYIPDNGRDDEEEK